MIIDSIGNELNRIKITEFGANSVLAGRAGEGKRLALARPIFRTPDDEGSGIFG
jgi:hypothetical protein